MKCSYTGECERGCSARCDLAEAERWNQSPARPGLSWVVLGVPQPLKRHRHGRGRTWDPSRKDKRALLAASLPYLPALPLEGPVELRLRFWFPIPKSWRKWQRLAAADATYLHVTKPDADNLAKLVLDALNGQLYRDDSQVRRLVAEKFYTDSEPRTEITCRAYEQAAKP